MILKTFRLWPRMTVDFSSRYWRIRHQSTEIKGIKRSNFSFYEIFFSLCYIDVNVFKGFHYFAYKVLLTMSVDKEPRISSFTVVFMGCPKKKVPVSHKKGPRNWFVCFGCIEIRGRFLAKWNVFMGHRNGFFWDTR